MTWQTVAVVSAVLVCASFVFAVWRLSRDAVSAKDLNSALNQIDADIKQLNQTLSPIFRGRSGGPLG